MQMTTEMERRQYPRVNIRWPILLLSHGGRLVGETINISPAGLCICLEKSLNPNERVRLAIEPPKAKPIWISGQVVWTGSERINAKTTEFFSGFYFLEIFNPDGSFIESFVH